MLFNEIESNAKQWRVFNMGVSYVSSVTCKNWSHEKSCKNSWLQKHVKNVHDFQVKNSWPWWNSPEDESLKISTWKISSLTPLTLLCLTKSVSSKCPTSWEIKREIKCTWAASMLKVMSNTSWKSCTHSSKYVMLNFRQRKCLLMYSKTWKKERVYY